jgi:hypothetical protein
MQLGKSFDSRDLKLEAEILLALVSTFIKKIRYENKYNIFAVNR